MTRRSVWPEIDRWHETTTRQTVVAMEADVRQGKRSRTRALVAAVTLGFLALPASGTSAQPLQGFDVTRWGQSGVVRIQEVNGGKLLSGVAHRGGARAENNTLELVSPNSITSIAADVTLLDVKMPAPTAGSSQAGIAGLWYWDGSGTGGAADQTGHVLAGLNVDADEATQTVQVRFSAVRCPDLACNFTAANVLTEITLSSQPIALFETHRLQLSYDNGTGTFTFQLDQQPAQVFVTPDAVRQAPASRLKGLRTRVQTEADPAAAGRILAAFDQVTVNGTPYETFDGKTLPRVSITPGSGTLASTQVLDVVVLAETGTDAVTGGRLFLNGQDVSSAAAAAVIQPIASGGLSVRFPAVAIGTIIPPGTSALVAVELTTARGETVRGFTLWRVVAVAE
jgi:hypothetical protein